MNNRVELSIRADRNEIEQLISVADPLLGGIWLATDLTTLVHWIVMAATITPAPSTPDGRICRATGLVTVCAPDGEPVFLINQGDTITWLEPRQALAVRELGEQSLEIRLERLDDLDARLMSPIHHSARCDASILRTIAVGDARYLQIYDEQLPTGDPAVDAILEMIETTIDARRRLIGPTAGTLDVLQQLAHDLSATLRAYPVRSFIWATVLREQIAGMRALLAA